jgi:hypothetical protein
MSGAEEEREPQDPPAWQTAPQAQPWGLPMAGWQPVPPTPGTATASLVFGLSSVVICPLVGPAAIVLGRRALRRIDGSEGALAGRGQAKWGVITGWAGVVLTLVMAVLVAIYAATA